MKKIRVVMAAGFLAASGGLLHGPAAHAVAGCSTLTDVAANQVSLLQCTFTADDTVASYHAEGNWTLLDAATGALVWFGEPSPVAQPVTRLPAQAHLIPGTTYQFVIDRAGFNFIETGI